MENIISLWKNKNTLNSTHQTQVPSERTGLTGDTLLQAPIPADAPSDVVDHVETLLVERSRQVLLGNRHAHGVAQPLAKRPGADLNSGSHKVLRVPGSERVELPELLALGEGNLVASKVQHRVLEGTPVAVAENESIAI